MVISDKAANDKFAPIPSLLATGGIHHHLIKTGLRGSTSLVIESGDTRETHHFATLIGFGASAVNPYMAYATISNLRQKKVIDPKYTLDDCITIYQKAIGKGLLKIMSKIGISTLQSYQGAQIFEALGINSNVIEECFRGTVSRIEGMGFDGIAEESLIKHRLAYPAVNIPNPRLEVGGVFQWKRRGEYHLFNPQTIHLLQQSTSKNNYDTYKK